MIEEHSINELAERVGVSPRTIRHYIDEGLLPPPIGAGRHQLFSREHEVRLRVAKALRDLGLTVRGVRTALASTPIHVLEKRLAALPQDVSPEQVGDLLSDLWQAPAPPPTQSRFAAFAPGEPSSHPRAERLMTRGPSERGAQWIRVALAPGVELHYQPSDDERRDAAIQSVVRDAEKRLSPFD